MAICEQCYHFNVCKNATIPNPEYKGQPEDKSKTCWNFVPTADVVQVVKCRNCKHAYFRYNSKDTLQEIYACKKRPTGRTHKKVGGNFFCAHGERSNT